MRTIYCDLDGVLADFDEGVKDISGRYPNEFDNIGEMWRLLANTPDFYYVLDWMPDGKHLWNSIKGIQPTILTGLPRGNWAAGQKKRWCGDYLGWHVPVITCWTSDKPNYCKSGDILIDDRTKIKDRWEQNGGIFVHHKNAAQTLVELKGLGVL